MQERGVDVDHATLQRWVVKYTPIVEANFRKKKRTVGKSWRMDETYIKIKGQWNYLYRAVDKEGNTIDFLLTKKRDTKAAKRFLIKAIGSNGGPEKITIDKSGANKAAIEEYNRENGTSIEIRQFKYLKNLWSRIIEGLNGLLNTCLASNHFTLPLSLLMVSNSFGCSKKGKRRSKTMFFKQQPNCSMIWLLNNAASAAFCDLHQNLRQNR